MVVNETRVRRLLQARGRLYEAYDELVQLDNQNKSNTVTWHARVPTLIQTIRECMTTLDRITEQERNKND